MEAFLFYNEHETLVPNQRVLIDSWCSMAGMNHIMVDKTASLRRTNGNVFGTIGEAVEAHPGHQWVFLSEKAETTLRSFEHPVVDVIYCVGSDTDGFQGLDLAPHSSVRLSTSHRPNNEWHAALVVPIVIADRMLRLM